MASRSGRRWLPPAALALSMVLAACGASGIFSNVGTAMEGGDAAAQPDQAREEAGGEAQPIPAGEDDAYAAIVEQRIIKTGEITLEVDSVGVALGEVRALVTGLGGYVGGSQAGTLDDRATITLRIPADRFDDALASLHELDAEVLSEATREQDVTGQVVDLEARIENLQASEATYRDLVARATEIDDILAVQSRLDEVRGQIEQLQGQLDAMTAQADLSTLTVTLVPVAAPVTAQGEEWDPGAQAADAVAALLGVGQALVTGLIWLGIVILPLALVGGVIALIAVRGGIELRRRAPQPTAPPADGA